MKRKPFWIACDCDMGVGEHVATEAQAKREGWTGIWPCHEGAMYTHTGDCPDCSRDKAEKEAGLFQ